MIVDIDCIGNRTSANESALSLIGQRVNNLMIGKKDSLAFVLMPAVSSLKIMLRFGFRSNVRQRGSNALCMHDHRVRLRKSFRFDPKK